MKQDLLRLLAFGVWAMGVQSASFSALAQIPLPARRSITPPPTPSSSERPSPVGQAVNKQVAEVQARQSAAPQFKWSGQTVPFKSRCFSDVCLGDDLAKLDSLKISWLGSAFALGDRTAPRGNMLQGIAAAFRGLNEADRKTLASALTNSFIYGKGSDYSEYKDLIPGGTFDYIVISADTLIPLNRATPCAVLPVLGVFKSQNGHYTSVLLMPENGKLTVVRIVRRWVLEAPAGASEVQQVQAIRHQLDDLSNQIGETFGGGWQRGAEFESMRVSADTVGYFNINRGAHPKLTLYTRSFAAYQELIYDDRFPEPDRGGAESPIDWQKVVSFVDKALSAAPGCEVSPAPPVKIN